MAVVVKTTQEGQFQLLFFLCELGSQTGKTWNSAFPRINLISDNGANDASKQNTWCILLCDIIDRYKQSY
jgi:hypothetical protein